MQIDPIRAAHIRPIGNECKPAATEAAEAAGVQPSQGPEAAAAAQAAEAASAAAAADQIILSQQAAEILAAHRALAALPQTRTELVAALKQKIEAGLYQANPEEIAKKMIP